MVEPKYKIIFYKEDSGRVPPLEWIRKLDKTERVKIGEDLQTVQYRWPLGMPLVKPIAKGIYEVRTDLPTRICRILFYVKDKIL